MKKKIALVVSGIAKGGVESFIKNYFSKMNLSHYDLYIITHNEPLERDSEYFINLGFKIIKVPSKRESKIKNIVLLYKIFKKYKFDIVHSHMAKSNFIVLGIAKICGIEGRIAHSHIVYENENIMFKFIQFFNRVVANFYVGCTKEALITGFGKKILTPKYDKNRKILYNAIDINKYSFNYQYRKEIRKMYKIKDDTILIGNIGRLTKQKNQEYLLEIFSKLKGKNSFKLMIVGEGDLKERLKFKCKELKIENNVIFVPPCDDINKYYSAFDIFVFPSIFEGLGMVLIEAQVSGLDCLTSTSVPREVQISDKIKFFDLNDKKDWVDNIMNIKDKKNIVRDVVLDNCPYDINNRFYDLEKIYSYYGGK